MLEMKARRVAIEKALEVASDGGAPVNDYVDAILTAYLEAVGEPVAWQVRRKDNKLWHTVTESELRGYSDSYERRPLYTAPQSPAVAPATTTDERAVEALREIVARSNNDPLGTSKVNDMRTIALVALATLDALAQGESRNG